MDKRFELTVLMDFYAPLLTEHRRQILSLRLEEDLTFQEIADQLGISRQGVHDQLTRAARRLFDMEEKLGMAARFRRMEDGLTRCREALRDKRYDDAEKTLDALIRLDQEESNGL